MAKNYIITQAEFEEVRKNSETALEASQSVLAKVESAVDTSDEAKTAANNAQTTADNAKTTADNAKTTADAAMPKAGGEFAGNTVAATTSGNQSGIRNMIFYDNAGAEITDNISIIKCYDK